MPLGTLPSAGRNSLSPRPVFKCPLHEGRFCLPRSRKDPTLSLTAGHPDAAGHEARAECQSRDQQPQTEFPLTPEPARLPTACPWQACWEVAPNPSPVRAQLRRHTHPTLVPTRPVGLPVTVPTFCQGVEFRSVPHPPDYTPPTRAPGQKGPSGGWASEHPPIPGTDRSTGGSSSSGWTGPAQVPCSGVASKWGRGKPASREACRLFSRTLGTMSRTLGREASRSILGWVKEGTTERGSGGDAGDSRQ